MEPAPCALCYDRTLDVALRFYVTLLALLLLLHRTKKKKDHDCAVNFKSGVTVACSIFFLNSLKGKNKYMI